MPDDRERKFREAWNRDRKPRERAQGNSLKDVLEIFLDEVDGGETREDEPAREVARLADAYVRQYVGEGARRQAGRDLAELIDIAREKMGGKD